jgi:flagellar motor component MotA
MLYVDLLAMLFEVLAKMRKEGLMSIEKRCRKPARTVRYSASIPRLPVTIT